MRRFNARAVRFSVPALALLLSLSLSGCKKEDPNPELLDPIYLDLQRRAGDAQKSFDDETKKLLDSKVALEKSEPNSLERKNAERDIQKSEHVLVDVDQKARFFKIRSERRLLVDRLLYKQAFAKNEVWPDPREYSEYLVNMRLQESPKNWNIRVPKLQDRLAKAGAMGQKGEKKEAKPE
jgi:hypothetical protein